MKYEYAVLAMAAILLVGCEQHKQQETQQATETKGEDTIAANDSSFVSKHIPYAGEFFQITNVSDADIMFSEGDCDIVIEGPEHLVETIRVSFDSGIVTFSQLEEGKSNMFSRKVGIGHATIYVSCPELRMLAVCGGGNFHSDGTIHSSSMHIGTLSLGGIDIDTLVVDDSFIYETSDNGDAHFGYIRTGGDATIYKSDNGNLDASICSDGLFTINASAKSTSRLSVEAPRVEMLMLDDSRCDMQLTTDNLNLSAFGHAMVDIKSHKEIKKKDVQRGKDAQVTFNINLDN